MCHRDGAAVAQPWAQTNQPQVFPVAGNQVLVHVYGVNKRPYVQRHSAERGAARHAAAHDPPATGHVGTRGDGIFFRLVRDMPSYRPRQPHESPDEVEHTWSA
jgi:hypothetical protein